MLFDHKYKSIISFFLLCSLFVLTIGKSIAQTNLVPNPSFEDITDCEILFGEASKAIPWNNIDETNIFTPDLFHGCAQNSFYNIPAGLCNEVFPRTGDGMIGIVNLIAEEGIYVRLENNIPQNQDIYVSFSVATNEKCGTPGELICYSNTPCLVFSDIQFQSQKRVLESDTIIYKTDDWTTMQTCYQADGSERNLLIGNFKSAIEELTDCDNIDEFNFSYFYIDDVIVAPFDVVPDTIFLCGDESIEMDASFFNLPISWSDDVDGPTRTIDQPGFYTVSAEIDDCFLNDNFVVIKIEDTPEIQKYTICKGGEITLTTKVPAIWDNEVSSKTRTVDSPGTYQAKLQTTCGERSVIYEVEEIECNIDYYVPNAFSPNEDGLNDQMEFYFNSEQAYSGQLRIFDRWGNLLYESLEVTNESFPTWDGTFNGKKINPAVFVWIFKYNILGDKRSRILTGDFVLLK